jgi:hypothetical protein
LERKAAIQSLGLMVGYDTGQEMHVGGLTTTATYL